MVHLSRDCNREALAIETVRELERRRGDSADCAAGEGNIITNMASHLQLMQERVSFTLDGEGRGNTGGEERLCQ